MERRNDKKRGGIMKKTKTFSFALAILLTLTIFALISCNDKPAGSTPAASDKNPPNEEHTHVWTDATCTLPKTCADCGATEGEAKGHYHTSVVTDPTCTEKGYTTYTCACGDTYKSDERAALGHAWIDPTCSSPKTCSVCKATEGEAKGHSYTSTVTVPTCTEKGYTTYTCTCGDTYNGNETDELGHDWLNADCTTPKTCSVCKATEGEAKGHSYTSTVTAPTCTEKGYTTYTCTCGDTYQGNESSALGHVYAESVTAPTCKKQGYTTHTCECGDTYKDSFTEALGHDWVNNPDGKTKSCVRSRCGTTQEICAIPDDKNLIFGLDNIPIATPNMTVDELREIVISFMRLQFSFGYEADMSQIPSGTYAY